MSPCTGLQGLWVHGNLLSSLPDNLGQLTSLRTLQLVGNRLQALPESISALTQLTDLGLAGNQLTAAPAVLGKLSELAANGGPRSIQALSSQSHGAECLLSPCSSPSLSLEQTWSLAPPFAYRAQHIKACASCTLILTLPVVLQVLAQAMHPICCAPDN